MMVRICLLVFVLAGMTLSTIGCTNTVRGVGKDTEKAGEAMQDYNQK